MSDATTYNSSFLLISDMWAWLGGRTSAGTLTWAQSGQVGGSFISWWLYEPGQDDECVVMFLYASGRYADIPCDEQRVSICEYDDEQL